MIYSIGIKDRNEMTDFGGRSVLENLAELTGGTAFFPPSVGLARHMRADRSRSEKSICARLSPSQSFNDGKWRKIHVKVGRPKGQSAVSVHAKSGYYASTAARAMK
jgi:hypothetical protein